MSAALRSSSLLPAAALLAWCWQAPQTGPAAPPALRITATLVQVDAVVTDSSGRHVPGLNKDDFQILQDGQPRKITRFSYVPEPPPAAEDSGPAAVTAGQVQRTGTIGPECREVDARAFALERLRMNPRAPRHGVEDDAVLAQEFGIGMVAGHRENEIVLQRDLARSHLLQLVGGKQPQAIYQR